MRYIRIMQPRSSDLLSQTAAATRALLASRGWTQAKLAKELNVDQPWVSNLVRGSLTQASERVRAAHIYVTNALSSDDIPQSVIDAVRGYIALGGDPSLLAEWIWRLAHPKPTKQHGRHRSRSTGMEKVTFAKSVNPS